MKNTQRSAKVREAVQGTSQEEGQVVPAVAETSTQEAREQRPTGLRAMPPRQVDLQSLPVVRRDEWPDGTTRTFVAVPFKALDRRVDIPLGKETPACVEACVRLDELYAWQSVVTIEGMVQPRDDRYGLPLVVRSNGISYIQDGHHRLAKEFYDGAQTARVRFLDLDALRRP